jgi:subtilisin family serine protease
MSRRLLAAATAAALTVTMTAGVASTAAADDPPPVPPVVDTDGLAPPDSADKVAPALAVADGPVTAFVELDATSGVETAEAGGDAADVEAAAAEVEQLAAEVVPDAATARSATAAPEALSVTTDLVAGVVVRGDAAALRTLAADPSVVSVRLMTPKVPMNKGSDVFTQAVAAWQATGQTGEGIRIGVIDTGLDYTHADFGGPGTPEAYAAAYGEDGTGEVPDDTYDPAKFLGGYDFAGPLYDAASDDPVALEPVPDANPIDPPNGHGTHVSGTAAGYGVLADGSTFDGDYTTLTDISDWKVGPGTAPEAGIYALKVFGDVEGSTNLTIDALEWAADPNGDGDYNDHLDVVNLSLGSDGSPADDPENLFVDQLTALGVVSVIASGNADDLTDIGGTPGNARSALTVANSVGDAQVLDGVEVTAAADPALVGIHAAQNTIAYTGPDVTAPVVFLGDTVDGCTSLAPYADQIAGKIVWLWWDDNDGTRACGSVGRWNNAAAAGAAGAIVGWSQPVFTYGLTGGATIPGAMLTADATTALLPEIQAGTLTARIGPGLANATFVATPGAADTVNSSSSRGVHGSLGIVKPDVAAPGTSISSANAGSGTEPSTKSGTSMATPHVAGIAALVRQAHPDWNATEVKAAVMNTATHDLYAEVGQTGAVYGPERVGSGRVDALAATTDEVLAWATDDPELVSVTFGVVDVGAEPVVLEKTVTVKNAGDAAAELVPSFAQATSAGGATVSVAPASLTVPAGQTRLVTVRLTLDPATLAKEIDPTSQANYDLGIAVPREFVTSISGRLVLTAADGSTLRVPVQAAPRLVSDLSAEPVAFDPTGTSTPLTLTGREALSGGWLSLVAPFVLAGESPQLEADASVGASPSVVASGDLRYVGFSSTYPQIVAAGLDPAVVGSGTIGIGIAVEGEWASLGLNTIPVIDIDTTGDGVPDFETVLWKYGPTYDFTTAETYSLAADGSLDELVDLFPINGFFADTETTAYDSNVVVAPVSIDALGLTPGTVPTFTVQTVSTYSTDPSGVLDAVEPFAADPFAPAFWFDDGNPGSLWYLGAAGEPFTVNRDAATGDGRLLLLHTANQAGSRAEVVDVTAPVPTPTTTTLAVTGRLAEGSEQVLTATVDPAGATGTVRFLDGTTELGTSPVAGGSAALTVAFGVGPHTLTAEYVPDGDAFAGSTSAPVTVEIVDLADSRLSVVLPRSVTDKTRAPMVATVRTDGARPTGTIEVREDGRLLASARVVTFGHTGVATFTVPKLPAGVHHLTISYSGNASVAPDSLTKDLRVTRSGRS